MLNGRLNPTGSINPARRMNSTRGYTHPLFQSTQVGFAVSGAVLSSSFHSKPSLKMPRALHHLITNTVDHLHPWPQLNQFLCRSLVSSRNSSVGIVHREHSPVPAAPYQGSPGTAARLTSPYLPRASIFKQGGLFVAELIPSTA